jgi:Holliday junction resolvase RusA-like endonuclease
VKPIAFFAAGVARPKGSSIPRVSKKTGKAHWSPASPKEYDWRSKVSSCASVAMEGMEPFTGPASVLLAFYAQRPKSHLSAKGKPTKKWQPAPIGAPDIDKLARSILDALKGIVFRDDGQVVRATIEKRYCDEKNPHVGVRVAVWPWDRPEDYEYGVRQAEEVSMVRERADAPEGGPPEGGV